MRTAAILRNLNMANVESFVCEIYKMQPYLGKIKWIVKMCTSNAPKKTMTTYMNSHGPAVCLS